MSRRGHHLAGSFRRCSYHSPALRQATGSPAAPEPHPPPRLRERRATIRDAFHRIDVRRLAPSNRAPARCRCRSRVKTRAPASPARDLRLASATTAARDRLERRKPVCLATHRRAAFVDTSDRLLPPTLRSEHLRSSILVPVERFSPRADRGAQHDHETEPASAGLTIVEGVVVPRRAGEADLLTPLSPLCARVALIARHLATKEPRPRPPSSP